MNWKNLKIKNKLFIAFGLLIVALLIVSLRSITGISGIVGDAEEVIDGNQLRTEMTTKYVDHLKWANEVSQLFLNKNVTELHVETDYRECEFGHWYYGQGRRHAEELLPELRTTFQSLEQPHILLHQSAIEIDEIYQPTDWQIGVTLREQKIVHLQRLNQLSEALFSASIGRDFETQVASSARECPLGQWLQSEEAHRLTRISAQMNNAVTTATQTHKQLHESIAEVEQLLQQNDATTAINHYITYAKPQAEQLIAALDLLINHNDEYLTSRQKAQEIYNRQTIANLIIMGDLLNKVVADSEKYIMTDENMIIQAQATNISIIIISIITLVLAVFFALFISNSLTYVIKKGVAFAREIEQGNLKATVNVYQQDEIGQLTDALRKMRDKLSEIISFVSDVTAHLAAASNEMSETAQSLSQNSTEQASNLEEISSAMEEMTSNIQQNNDHAQQTKQIVNRASGDISKGNQQVNQTVEAMKQIADKVKIISEIANETNLLALNAAVEAAGAGAQGKGFAVVASEVRKLAENSRKAAVEINDLSTTSVNIAEISGKLLEEIVPQIVHTVELIQEVAEGTNEQQTGANQINNAIQQLNKVTQQTAAVSEEMATSSEQLSAQAEKLKEAIAYFK